MKKVWAIVAIFFSYAILDFVIHRLILGSAYAATAQLWRPMAEMKMWLMYLVTLLSTIAFVEIWARLIGEKSMKNGIIYGLLFGFAAGVSFGYGTYSAMDIPYFMAFTWFFGTLVEGGVAGLLASLIVKE